MGLRWFRLEGCKRESLWLTGSWIKAQLRRFGGLGVLADGGFSGQGFRLFVLAASP